MRSSMGFHTFTVFLKLIESEAGRLYRAFQECSDVRVRPIGKGEATPHVLPNGYAVEYLDRNVGIRWYMRFSSQVGEYMHMSLNPQSPNYQKEPTPYSVRATINPKVLNGIKDYLTAANADCLDEAEGNFNV
jgi:hypothetical protein